MEKNRAWRRLMLPSMNQSPTAAAFFDLDKTIIAKSSTLAFARPLSKAGFLNRRSLMKAGIAQAYYSMFGADHDQLERVREELGEMTKGWDKAELEQLISETVEEVVSPLVFAEALAIIDEHRRAGRKVVVISSSPTEIVSPFGSYLAVDEVIGTRPEIDEKGKYTGGLDFYAYAEGKAEAIRELAEREGLDLSASYAYSDSITDLPMLECVGHPVAVNPDKELREIAEERDWQTMQFERPVTLRTRLATVPKPVPVVSGAAVAGGLAAALAVWMLRGRRRA
jgi:HAD superfamily hydrolase (TIGR01490 family)